MKIELDIGEAVVVTFAGTDGEITVGFCNPDVPTLVGCREEVARHMQSLGGIVVHADMPDTSGRGGGDTVGQGAIYHEPLSSGDPEDKELLR